MPSCAVYQCKNTTRNSIKLSFFRFPKDKNLAEIWKKACKIEDKYKIENARICSDHFVESDYKRNLKQELLNLPEKRKFLNKDAIPSTNVCSDKKRNNNNDDKRSKRQKKREQKKNVDEMISKSYDENTDIPNIKLKNTLISADNHSSRISNSILEENDTDRNSIAFLKKKIADLETQVLQIKEQKIICCKKLIILRMN